MHKSLRVERAGGQDVMSGRIFQNVVLQLKESTDRTIGLIDADGTIIACSELTGIGI